MRAVIVLAAFLPPVLMLTYGIAKGRDSWRSESMWTAVCIGAVSAIAAGMIELLLSLFFKFGAADPILGAAKTAILLAAIPEETTKFLVLLVLAEKYARRLQDVLILAVAVSVGFATLENLLCIMAKGHLATAVVRAITSIPGQGMDALAMGALVIAARLRRGHDASGLILALIVPVILHAAYDFPLLAMQKGADKAQLSVVWGVVMICSAVFVIVLCRHVLAKAVAADQASGCDDASTETTDRLMIGGVIALFGGPMLAASYLYAEGSKDVGLMALSILPMAFGLDSIFTGLDRRRERKLRVHARAAADFQPGRGGAISL
ncbi:MAG: PrsW family glutamic-type intramembrane protease [Xanthobacteraceae bacterium]